MISRGWEGTGAIFKYIPGHQLVEAIGPEIRSAMPVFHALTENDTVSHLVVEESKLPGTLGKVFPKSLKHSSV